jgi:hypothetical protein
MVNRTRAVVVRSSIGAAVMFALLACGRVQAAPDRSSEALVAPPATAHASTPRVWRPRAWAPAARVVTLAQAPSVVIAAVDGARVVPGATEQASRLAIAAETPVRIERRPNGRLLAHLDESQAEYLMVTVGADGRPSVTCLHGSEGVASFMKQALVPVATPSSAREGK